MAKLSARGRTVVAQVKKTESTPEDAHVSERMTVKALMSDGKILVKYQTRFRPDQYRPAGELHSTAWSVMAHLKAGLVPAEVAAKWLAKYTDAGYAQVK